MKWKQRHSTAVSSLFCFLSSSRKWKVFYANRERKESKSLGFLVFNLLKEDLPGFQGEGMGIQGNEWVSGKTPAPENLVIYFFHTRNIVVVASPALEINSKLRLREIFKRGNSTIEQELFQIEYEN